MPLPEDFMNPLPSNLRRARTETGGASGPPPLIIRTCDHILKNRRRCGGAACRGQNLCRHHLDLRARGLRIGRAERQIHLRFRVPLLQDMQAIRLAAARVRYALDAGHMAPSTARLLFFGLRLASGNLRFMEEEARWMDLAEADLDREADAQARRDMPTKSNQLYQVRRSP
jgi:hypothetical protein